MSDVQSTVPSEAPEAQAAPDSYDDIRGGLAERLAAPSQPPQDASRAPARTDEDEDAPEEPAAEPAAPDSGDETPDVPQADPLAGLSRRQRGELLKHAQTQLQQEHAARAAAEQRAAQLEQLHSEADTLLVALEATDEQLSDLRRRARDGDAYARQQADIYEANRETLGPIRLAMRKQETAKAWGLIGNDFKAMAALLPAERRAAFLGAPNIKDGGQAFAKALTEHVEQPLKDEIKALKAEIKGLKATNGSRGVAPAAGGRSALGAPDPNATSYDDIREGLRERLSRTG